MNKDTSSDLASANGNDVMLSSVECGEVPRRPDRVKMASKENVFAFITFVIMGTAAMAFWNTLIVSIFSVQSFLYTDHPNISDTITAVYTTLSLVMTAALIRFQILNVKFLVLGALGFVISSFAYAFTCQTARVCFSASISFIAVNSQMTWYLTLFFSGTHRCNSIPRNSGARWFMYCVLWIIDVRIRICPSSELRRCCNSWTRAQRSTRFLWLDALLQGFVPNVCGGC